MQDATVTVKDAGGTVLDSGVTDSSGNFTPVEGACGTNRTVVIAQTGYTTTTFTGQNLSCGSTVNLNMSGAMDSTNNACCYCAIPKTLHYSFTSVISGVSHSGSGTITYRPANNDWTDFLVCFDGRPYQRWTYDDPDTGSTTCLMAPTSIRCDPFSVTFGLPDNVTCPNFAADTGYTAFSMTITP